MYKYVCLTKFLSISNISKLNYDCIRAAIKITSQLKLSLTIVIPIKCLKSHLVSTGILWVLICVVLWQSIF